MGQPRRVLEPVNVIFRPTSFRKLAEHQMREARMALLDHEAAAEFNGAMARMLRERITRLESQLNQFQPEEGNAK